MNAFPTKSILNSCDGFVDSDNSEQIRIESIKDVLRKERRSGLVDEIEGRVRAKVGQRLKKMRQSLGGEDIHFEMGVKEKEDGKENILVNENEEETYEISIKETRNEINLLKDNDKSKMNTNINIETENEEKIINKKSPKFRIPTFDFCKEANIFKNNIYRPKSKFPKTKSKPGESLSNLPEVVECTMQLNRTPCLPLPTNLSSHYPHSHISTLDNVVLQKCADEVSNSSNGYFKGEQFKGYNTKKDGFSDKADNCYNIGRKNTFQLDVIANIDDKSIKVNNNETEISNENNRSRTTTSTTPSTFPTTTSATTSTQFSTTKSLSFVTQISKIDRIIITNSKLNKINEMTEE